MKGKILLADDEASIVEFIQDALEDEGYEVLVANNGNEVFKQLVHKPELIILDIMMPGPDGFEVCRAVREMVSCPIIFLSARYAESDRIQGLAVGGDDYIVKPFSMRELKARLAAHLRREQRAGAKASLVVLHYGDISVDLNSYRLLYRGQSVPVTVREFEIVQLLALHPDRVFSREQIYEKVWGYDAEGNSQTVTEHVKNIRAKLVSYNSKCNPIATVWGIGYKWVRV
ncbi:response regulator transcription factor [Aneurinibacillus aneurinilyticus]|uniref:Response regulator transcription factor n=2 Tax=Aneurinibacillus aneurinilyticus TaxID=1391 RepID=A0A848CV07_ANEAE|nr:response regulator transcription factor [Aneurinibacillus aneurinilyticus]ERI09710.1 putative subtilin biosynthesis regulatory protein SpaR [Aneurinibacillus aneurinilyticus ATCC 12856]MED0708397.1 response regulator transcription factor [Aneurinibacillus aneurinilyticus]MED0722536.1 response regulator transcription factor [Aneurinibacillus aneurinilyticus]MED0732469.1 response regulator transcription factor [Aneurinibacillus aneurinilyticus]MED0741914.1 response regulator transcription fac